MLVRAHGKRRGDGTGNLKCFWDVTGAHGDISSSAVCSASSPLGKSHAPVPVFQVRLLTLELCPSLSRVGNVTQGED